MPTKMHARSVAGFLKPRDLCVCVCLWFENSSFVFSHSRKKVTIEITQSVSKEISTISQILLKKFSLDQPILFILLLCHVKVLKCDAGKGL